MAEMETMRYKVGALMYTPALNANIGEKIVRGAFPELDSLCLCLEDTVTEKSVRGAEEQLVKTLKFISEHRNGDMPLLFVRVRDAAQLDRMPKLLDELLGLLTGVTFPKFDLSNAAEYCALARRISAPLKTPLYIMPVLESHSLIRLETRRRCLLGLRELLDGYRDLVLNIRVGAMDFCHFYGLRRSVTQSIYDIGVVRGVLSDILTVFSDAYVVSAPVWEYFDDGSGDEQWLMGLENELRLDIANGFVGKTVIHPSQLPVVRKWLKPSRADYEDAKAVLNWRGGELGVVKSFEGNRMNELATHKEWARKIVCLARNYGVRDL
jgi:citrate lyase beta subunit